MALSLSGLANFASSLVMVPGTKAKYMILYHFTWPQFLTAAFIGLAAWYAVIAVVYYRREISDFFKGKTRQPERLKRDWEEELEEDQDESLMGTAREPDGLSTVTSLDLHFNRLGVIPDVLEELKSIFHILDRDGGTKADFIALFGLVSAKYPQVKGSPDQDALNDYIRENLPFEISGEELESLWV